MDTLMLVITGVSVLVAVTASFVAWRAIGAERRRSAARVAALAAAAEVPAEQARLRERAPVVGDTHDDLHEFIPAVEAVAERYAAAAASTDALLGAPVADSGSSGRQHRLLAAAAVVFVLVGGGSLALLVSGRAPSVTTAPAGVPLELVALSHARPEGQLAISGLVHNPAAGARLEQLEAHVRVFDAAGILIATRSAPVDAVALVPGADAPFSVTVGEASTAARYRVSFASRGAMLAHVDRRTNLPAAVTADAR
jgi:hypothetical protein